MLPPALFPDAQVQDARIPDARIPDALFPAALPLLPRLRLSACRRPAAGAPETEGEWLDVVVLPGGATALVIGSAAAPAGQAGAAAARLRAGLRDSLRGGAAPAEALARLDAAAGGSPGGRGATACLAVLNPLTGELRYAAAGQPAPVICPPAGNGWRPGPVRGSPGDGPDAGRPEAGTAVLPPGAVMLLYSGPARLPDEDRPDRSSADRDSADRDSADRDSADRDSADRDSADRDSAAGAARRVADTASSILRDADSAPAADTADRVVPAVLAGLTGDGHAGSATVLAAHRLPAPVGGWSMNMPGDPVALRELRSRLRDWLRELGASPSDRTDVELAVWEAAVNAVVHGRPAKGAARVTVHAALDEAGRAVIQVSDRGRWRPPGPLEPGRRWPGGQGLLVIRQAADELDIAPGLDGTTVTVRRSLSRPVPGQPQPAEHPATAARPGTPA
jgi:anti-sigma regulatory factor (Ser/Thr protein kinase)